MITLIGKKLAKPGQEFIHYGVGSSRECMGCKLRKVCDNLEVGRRYVVRSSMNKPHEECRIHDEGVMLVEVEPAEIQALLPSQLVSEGATITFIRPDCMRLLCENSVWCFPEGLGDGDRCQIVKVISDGSVCPLGAKMTMVALRSQGQRKEAGV